MQLTVVVLFHCLVTLSKIQCLVRLEVSLFLKDYYSGHLCALGFAIDIYCLNKIKTTHCGREYLSLPYTLPLIPSDNI